MRDLVVGVVGAGFLVMQPLVAQEGIHAGMTLWVLAGGMAVAVAAAFLRLAPLPGPGTAVPAPGRPALAGLPATMGRWVTPLYLIGFAGGTSAFALITVRLVRQAVAGPRVVVSWPGAAAVTGLVILLAAGLSGFLRRRPWQPAGMAVRLVLLVVLTVAVPSAPTARAVLAPHPPAHALMLVLPLAVTIVGFEPCLAGKSDPRDVVRAVAAIFGLIVIVAVPECLAMSHPVGPFPQLTTPGPDRGVALGTALLLLTFIAGNLNALERFGASLLGARVVRPWWGRAGTLAVLTGVVTTGLVQGWHQVWLLSISGVCTTVLYSMAIRGAQAAGRHPAARPDSAS